MPKIQLFTHRLTCVAIAALLSGCAGLTSTDYSASLGIYRPDVLQGNVVTAEQVAVLKPGLTRSQVTRILGTPLLKSAFRNNRWDYVFTRTSTDAPSQQRGLVLWFDGDLLTRFEGDDMPTERKFVDSLVKPLEDTEPPKLTATPEELAAFKAEQPSAAEAVAPAAPVGKTYPPLNPEGQQ